MWDASKKGDRKALAAKLVDVAKSRGVKMPKVGGRRHPCFLFLSSIHDSYEVLPNTEYSVVFYFLRVIVQPMIISELSGRRGPHVISCTKCLS